MTTSKKRGRKPNYHISADGTPIKGLGYDRKSNRWRVIATNRFFRAADEKAAILKFQKLTNTVDPEKVVVDHFQSQIDMRTGFGAGGSAWRHVAEEINKRPAWVAEQTGIEWLAYGPTLKAPKEIPSPKDLAQLHWDHCEVTNGEKRAVRDAWKHFIESTGIKSIRDITSVIAREYKEEILKKDWTRRYMKHRFNRLRRVLSFAIEMDVAIDDINRVLPYLKFKMKRQRKIIMPKPISRENFQTFYKAAKGQDKAMILLMLNDALYLQEVVRVRWDEIHDGCFVSNRQKEGQCLRVAKLWTETLEALSEVKRRGEFVFISETGLPLTVSGAGKRFRKLRKDSGVAESIKANNFRDGAATAMRKAGIDDSLRKLLMGHSCGMEDSYVLRDPGMVEPATTAIHKFYLG